MKYERPYPITEAHRLRLKAELEEQKQRLSHSSRRAIDILRTDMSATRWLRSYPRQIAILALVGGFVAARLLQQKKRNFQRGNSYLNPPNSEVA